MSSRLEVMTWLPPDNTNSILFNFWSRLLLTISTHRYKRETDPIRTGHKEQSPSTHQRLGHDDAYLALWHVGEVGEQALEDVLARLALRVDANGHHGRRTLLSLRTADWRDGGFTVSVPHGRGCGHNTKTHKMGNGSVKSNIGNSSTNKRDRISCQRICLQREITE